MKNESIQYQYFGLGKNLKSIENTNIQYRFENIENTNSIEYLYPASSYVLTLTNDCLAFQILYKDGDAGDSENYFIAIQALKVYLLEMYDPILKG